MKRKLSLFAAAWLAVASFVSSVIAADSTPRRYLVLEYQKPATGKRAEYVKLEREPWKAIHQARVNAGKILSWKLYLVSYPNGESQEYDYVTVTEYPSWAALEQPYAGISFSAVLGEAKSQEMLAATRPARKLVRKDTLSIEYATDNFSASANQSLSVHFLKALPGGAGDFMKVQREYYLPLNSELAKASGGESGWASTAVRYPEHADSAYTHVSFNAHASLASMESDRFNAIHEKWRPKFRELSPLQDKSRQRVRNELWRLVDQTERK